MYHLNTVENKFFHKIWRGIERGCENPNVLYLLYLAIKNSSLRFPNYDFCEPCSLLSIMITPTLRRILVDDLDSSSQISW